MSSETSLDRFSTVAEFELLVGGRSYQVAQVAPDFIILDKPAHIDPGSATLIIRVDGQEIRREVLLSAGAHAESTRVPISRQ